MIEDQTKNIQTKGLSSQPIREYVPKGYAIDIVVETNPAIQVKKDVKCGSLVHNSDSSCNLLVKIICILSFLPAIIIWKLLQWLAYSLKTFYQRYLRRCITYLKLTTYIFLVIMAQQIRVLCLKFTECTQDSCNLISSCFKNIYRQISKCYCFVGSSILNCLRSCGNCFTGCCVYLRQKIAQLILFICKFPGKFLHWYVNLTLRVLLKCVEIQITIKETIQLISVAFSLLIIAPTFHFLLDKILFSIYYKIETITCLILTIVYLHIIKLFYELFILNIYKLLKYLLLEVLIMTIINFFFKGIYQLCIFIYRKLIVNVYNYFIIKCLYRGIIVNIFKLLKFIFYTIIYLKIVINILKIIKWILQKLMLFIKYFCQGCKKLIVMIFTLFTKFFKGILQCICKVITKMFKIIGNFSYKYLLLPIRNFFKKTFLFVTKLMLRLWNIIKFSNSNQNTQVNNS